MNELPTPTNIKEEASGNYSAEINGKTYSGISTAKTIIPAHTKTVDVVAYEEVTEEITDPVTGEPTTRTYQRKVVTPTTINIPERTVWDSRFGEAVQKAIDEGAEVTPLPTPSIEELKEKAMTAIDRKTAKLIISGVEHNNETFSTSEAAQTNLLAMEVERLAGRMTLPLYWSTVDGGAVALTTEAEFTALHQAVLGHVYMQKVLGQQERAKVAAMTTKEQVEGYVDER